jgi:hypothetical protein
MAEDIQNLWGAYRRARDNGHLRFIRIAERCEEYFRGEQWDADTLRQLGDRPALTVNMILATMATAFGQMLENYTETMFFANDPRMSDMNAVMQKVFRHVYNENRLRWLDMDMAIDGFITGRGFLDVRMCFDENLRGDVKITHLDPRDVLIDPDAREYLPTSWKEVFISRWLTLDEIRVLYGPQKAKLVEQSGWQSLGGTHDVISDFTLGGTFGGKDGLQSTNMPGSFYGDSVPRRYRVVERQYRKLHRHEFFVDLDTGESREVPLTWDEEKIARVLESARSRGARLTVVSRTAERIRITVFAGAAILHDDWSPYKHFTVVPYFPYFRWGHTMGVVENILDLQDATNKTLSQSLHVINTTANSGWIVKAGSLVNMTVQELEERGAETGLVLEVAEMGGVEKIQPNAIPAGLSHIANQLSDWVKYVSGISDSMRGFDRADVAAKAIVAKQQAGAISLAIPFESLNRTRHYLAEVVLGMIQRFYTEPRLMRVAPDALNGEEEVVAVNQPDLYGRIINDLTLGEYTVVVKTVPPQERQKETNYQRAKDLREIGVPIPDWVLIETSGLPNPTRIMEDISKAQEAQSPAQQLEMSKIQAEIQKLQSESEAAKAQAALLLARIKEVVAQVYGTHAKMKLQDKATRLNALLQDDKMRREDAYRYRKLAIDAMSQTTQEDSNGIDSSNSGGAGGTVGRKSAAKPGESAEGNAR